MGKLINRKPGSRLLISSLPGSALSTSVLKALPGKLDIKRHSPSILYLSIISHINCIVARCLIKLFISRHVPLSGHDDIALFNDVANDVESTQKSKYTS